MRFPFLATMELESIARLFDAVSWLWRRSANSPNRGPNVFIELRVRNAPFEYRDLSQGGLASLWQRLTSCQSGPHSYWLTRFIILRMLGLVYFVAFLSLAQQILPLIGSQGLLPVSLFFRQAERFLGSSQSAFLQFPSIFWMNSSDLFLVAMGWLGVVLSAALLLGFANGILLIALWVIYLSFVHIGQDWYSYGWEIQLLETGFLAVFLCPLLDGRPFTKRPPPTAVIWLFRWLIFRVMLGAGLIKLRGDSCWRDLTCLYYHYETQPIPNPLSSCCISCPIGFISWGRSGITSWSWSLRGLPSGLAGCDMLQELCWSPFK